MKPTGILSIAILALCAPAATAHHAFGAEFDPNLPVQLRGPLKRIEWVNPHAWFHVEHANEDGSTSPATVWMVQEAGTPNTLFRRGITRNTVPLRARTEPALHRSPSATGSAWNGFSMVSDSTRCPC